MNGGYLRAAVARVIENESIALPRRVLVSVAGPK
jgi:hypothetical protein